MTPSVPRCVALLSAAVVGIATLVALPTGQGPPAHPGHLLVWWHATGTAAAGVTIVRAFGVAVGGWLLVVAIAGLVAALRSDETRARPWRLLTPAPLRLVLFSGALGVADPGPAFAADDPTPMVLTDLGTSASSESSAAVLRELGPVLESQPTPEETSEHDERWLVARGDHLWHVAEETLRDRGLRVDEADVARYWTRLIEANRDVVGDDPDTIHPGDVLLLPSPSGEIRAGS